MDHTIYYQSDCGFTKKTFFYLYYHSSKHWNFFFISKQFELNLNKQRIWISWSDNVCLRVITRLDGLFLNYSNGNIIFTSLLKCLKKTIWLIQFFVVVMFSPLMSNNSTQELIELNRQDGGNVFTVWLLSVLLFFNGLIWIIHVFPFFMNEEFFSLEEFLLFS